MEQPSLHHSAQSRCPPQATWGSAARPESSSPLLISLSVSKRVKERRPQFCLHGTPAPLGTDFPLPHRGHTAGCSPLSHWPQQSQAGSQAQLLLWGFWNWDQAGRQAPEAAGERCKLGNLLVAMFYLITGTASRGRRPREVRDRRGGRGDVSDGVPPLPEAQLHPCSGRPPISFQYLHTAQELPQASQACLKSRPSLNLHFP